MENLRNIVLHGYECSVATHIQDGIANIVIERSNTAYKKYKSIMSKSYIPMSSLEMITPGTVRCKGNENKDAIYTLYIHRDGRFGYYSATTGEPLLALINK